MAQASRRAMSLHLLARHRLRPPGHQRSSVSAGFTIVEGLIAMVILTVSIGGLALLTSRQWASSKDVDVLGILENVVAEDLGWQKTYAKQWRMTTGPYNLTCTQAGFGSGCTAFVFSSTETEYDPDPTKTRCPNATASTTDTDLASDFLSDAASVTLTPARPYPLAVGSTTLVQWGASAAAGIEPRLPKDTSLVRTISLGKNVLYLSYAFNGTNAAPYRFLREVALRPEATAWCP